MKHLVCGLQMEKEYQHGYKLTLKDKYKQLKLFTEIELIQPKELKQLKSNSQMVILKYFKYVILREK